MGETEQVRVASDAAACYATFLIDRVGMILTWSPGVAPVLGYSEEEFIGRDFATLFVDDDRKAGVPLQELNDARAVRCVEPVRQHIRKDGATIWVDGTITPLFDETGELTSYVKVMRDCSCRRRDEDKLREQARLLDLAADAIIVRDADDRIEYWNSGAEALYGWTADEARGRSFHEMLRTEFSVSIETIKAEVARTGRWRGELVHYKKNGESLTVLSRWVRDADRVLETNSDLTERKAIEQTLKRSNEELEEFASVASHDMSEPLRMVNAYLALLKRKYDGRLDKEAQEFIGFAVDGVRRMRELIDMLLEYSRAQRAKRPFSTVNTEAAISRARSNLMVPIEEKQALVRVGEIPRIWGDGVQLVQLFQNLIGNALKYQTPAARPEIDIDGEELAQEWKFTVRDNGIGISMEYACAIFEPFRRLHNRQEYPGTGLGLAVCKKIIERHGGRIWVESGLGLGAAFHFTIPKDVMEPEPR